MEIKGIFITDCQPELENVHSNQENEQFSLSVEITQNNSLTEKCSDETAEIKKKLIELEYEKKRRANESEESRQKRLAQKRENRRKKQESRQKRLASQSKYQKEKKC